MIVYVVGVSMVGSAAAALAWLAQARQARIPYARTILAVAGVLLFCAGQAMAESLWVASGLGDGLMPSFVNDLSIGVALGVALALGLERWWAGRRRRAVEAT